jgi:hypothetical protein
MSAVFKFLPDPPANFEVKVRCNCDIAGIKKAVDVAPQE